MAKLHLQQSCTPGSSRVEAVLFVALITIVLTPLVVIVEIQQPATPNHLPILYHRETL
jgi:hypothetical protein